MKLHYSPRTSVGGDKVARLPFGLGQIDEAIKARFAVAEDRAGSITGGGIHCLLEPVAVSRGDQDFRVNAAKGFGVGIVDVGAVCRHRILGKSSGGKTVRSLLAESGIPLKQEEPDSESQATVQATIIDNDLVRCVATKSFIDRRFGHDLIHEDVVGGRRDLFKQLAFEG